MAMLWVPSSCSLRDFNGSHFCELLAGRRLLFIGDSTMQQLASVVMNTLAWTEGRSGSACSAQVLFGHSDTLVGRGMGNLNRGEPWLKWIDAAQPAVASTCEGLQIWFTGVAYA